MSVAILSENYQNELYRFEHVLPIINNPYYWRELANYYRLEGKNLDKAELYYLKVLKMGAYYNGMLDDIASTCYNSKKYKETILFALNSLDLKLATPYTIYMLYISYKKLKDYRGAIKLYLKLIRMNLLVVESDAYMNLAYNYVKTKQYKKAIKAMKYAREHFSENFDTLYSSAYIYAMCSDKENTLLYLERAFILDSKFVLLKIKKDKKLKTYKNNEDFKALLAKYA